MADHDRMLLTPKNLYRLLTGRLSLANRRIGKRILPEETMIGMTVTHYWKDLLSVLLPEETVRHVFPEDGSHPRVQSNMLNRSSLTGTPALVRDALDHCLSPQKMDELIRYHMRFFLVHQYAAGDYRWTLNQFEDLCFRDDLFIQPSQQMFLASLRDWDPGDNASGRYSAWLFRDAVRMAWLDVFAMYGTRMGDTLPMGIFLREDMQIMALWENLLGKGLSSDMWEILGGREALLGSPTADYVLLSTAPDEIALRLPQVHRLQITGLGGAGKTELARQALCLLRQSGLYDRVAFVLFEGTLTDSLIGCFPDQIGSDRKQLEHAVQDLLNGSDRQAKRTLLVVDNLDGQALDAEEQAFLSSLTCDILATARVESLLNAQTIRLDGLDEKGTGQLFSRLSGKTVTDAVASELFARTGGHPMTVKLMSEICRMHYWTPQTFLRQMDAGDFGSMLVLRGHDTETIAEVMRGLMQVGDLTESDRRLLRLMALLPLQSWTPDALSELAADMEREEKKTWPIRMDRMAQYGFLVRGASGCMLHPVIAETLRQTPFAADEFPKLWQAWAACLQPPMTPEKQPIYTLALQALLRCEGGWNRDAVQVLTAIEMTAMTRSWLLVRHPLPAMHRAWLDHHEHSQDEELTWQIINMLWALLEREDCDFATSAAQVRAIPKDVLAATPYYDVLMNVLEIGGSRLDKTLLDALFEQLAPPEEDVLMRVTYLNFLGGKQRKYDKNPRQALQTLGEAARLIEANGMRGGVEEAANDTRTAYALADLGLWSQTLPLMRRVLENLKNLGYADDSQTVSTTRNAYDYFRGRCSERQQALSSLSETLSQMRSDGREKEKDYLYVLQDYAVLLAEDGRGEEAEETLREAAALCEHLPATDAISRIHLWRRFAVVLFERGKEEEALGYIILAHALCVSFLGADAEDTRVCDDLRRKILDQRLKGQAVGSAGGPEENGL